MGLVKNIIYKKIEDLKEIDKVVDIQAKIWGKDTVSPKPQLIASIHHGGIVIGAFDGEKLVGFCYGFPGFKDGETYLISHMAGILEGYQNGGIGFQLKVKQRDWAMKYGYKKIVWTFDPLEIRNGYFNLNKLGAYSKRYFASYYGEMEDKLNKGLPTDRLLIEWEICSKPVERTLLSEREKQIESAYKLLFGWKEGEGNFPIPVETELIVSQQEYGYLVPVPSGIQVIKKQTSEGAYAWRYAIRAAISVAFSKGFVITGVKRNPNSKIHFYILENKLAEG